MRGPDGPSTASLGSKTGECRARRRPRTKNHPVSTAEISLLSINSHGGVGPRSKAPFPLAEELTALDADVLVVQECWRPDVGPADIDRVHQRRGGHLVEVDFGRGVVLPHPELRPHGNGRFSIALLSRFPVEVVEEISLRNVRFDPLEDRRALHARIDVNGTPLAVVALHTTSRLPHGPPLQLRSLLPRLPTPGTPTAVIGDCNFWATGVDRIFRGWKRAVRGATWPAWQPHSQIDHILVRPDDVTVLDGGVLPDLGSDHRPVRARLRIG